MTKTVVGLFETQAAAEAAINALVAHGYTNDQIGVSLRGETRAASASANDPLLAETGNASATDATAAFSAAGGATLGGTIGALLTGAGALAFPGIGLIIAAGPIVTALGGGLAGAGLGAALASITGGSAAQATTDERVDVYADVLQYGGVILTVQADDAQVQDVGTLFAQNGAVDLAQRRAALSPTDSAVREADALDKPAVDQVASALNDDAGGTQQVATPVSDTGLASGQAVAATQPSGLASLKAAAPTNAPQGIDTPQTTATVNTEKVSPTPAHNEIAPLPYTPPEPYLTADLQQFDDAQPDPTPVMSDPGIHDAQVGTMPGTRMFQPARQSRIYGDDTYERNDPVDHGTEERDMTLSDVFGGAMELPDGPQTSDITADRPGDVG